jgi:hypothetical protein
VAGGERIVKRVSGKPGRPMLRWLDFVENSLKTFGSEEMEGKGE